MSQKTSLRRYLESDRGKCQEEDEETLESWEHCKVLVVGAGGLGNYILKALGLAGVRHIHLVDMDTLEISNLNRQVLFREEDIGKSKAEVAARVINNRLARLGVTVTPHMCRIQSFEPGWFLQFSAVVAGLDNIDARRWLNATLCGLVRYQQSEDGKLQLDSSTLIPLIDGGTEGFMGHCRTIIPGATACYECSMEAFAPQQTFPMCTVVDKPRLPEHCVAYALMVLWPKSFDREANFDEEVDIKWLAEQAALRAESFAIEGVTPELTLGVVKRIVPAISATNQVIGSLLVNELLKVMLGRHPLTGTYIIYNAAEGANINCLTLEPNPTCQVCSSAVMMGIEETVSANETLAKWLGDKQLYKPTVRTVQHLLYGALPEAFHEEHKHKLDMTFKELIEEGHLKREEILYVYAAGEDNFRKIRLKVL